MPGCECECDEHYRFHSSDAVLWGGVLAELTRYDYCDGVVELWLDMKTGGISVWWTVWFDPRKNKVSVGKGGVGNIDLVTTPIKCVEADIDLSKLRREDAERLVGGIILAQDVEDFTNICTFINKLVNKPTTRIKRTLRQLLMKILNDSD